MKHTRSRFFPCFLASLLPCMIFIRRSSSISPRCPIRPFLSLFLLSPHSLPPPLPFLLLCSSIVATTAGSTLHMQEPLLSRSNRIRHSVLASWHSAGSLFQIRRPAGDRTSPYQCPPGPALQMQMRADVGAEPPTGDSLVEIYICL